MIRKISELIELARRKEPMPIIACAGPDDSDSLESLRMALDAGIGQPLAVGRQRAIQTVAETLGISLDGFEFYDVPDPKDAPAVATRLVHDGKASILMKGSVSTKSVIRAVLDSHAGLRSGRMLSHAALFDAPALNKPVLVTDAGVNIRPNLSQKIEIVKNAVDVMQRLGLRRPLVAILAAIERVELPAMPATLDAKLIEKMSAAGLLGDAIVQGPLALDDAVSPDVARSKGIGGPVAGRADIVVAPEIETGNVLYKALTCFAEIDCAAVVWGAKVPIVVASRADTARTKFLSISLASVLSGNTANQ